MDSICFKTGIHSLSPSMAVHGVPIEVRSSSNPAQVSAVSRKTTSSQSKSQSKFSFSYPLRSLWPGGHSNRYKGGIAIDDAVLIEEERKEQQRFVVQESEEKRENWVLKILHVKSLWREGEDEQVEERENQDLGVQSQCSISSSSPESESAGVDDDDDDTEKGCDGCSVDYDEQIEFDRDSFSRLLKRVSLAEARFYAKMSYLGNLAYSVSNIKRDNLLKRHGLWFVTSSVERREQATKVEKAQHAPDVQETSMTPKEPDEAKEQDNGYGVSAFAAYQIAASAASYLYSRTTSILPFTYSKPKVNEVFNVEGKRSNENANTRNSDAASFKATTDSVTAVVAAKEEVKQAVADHLNSMQSSPCEWFACDDEQSATRFFVIQGSESMASWQANLLFEPSQFEGMDVLVHRGIYEVAKGIYDQMLPDIRSHLRSNGSRARFRFTGHSLGGSLSLLINLMLLIRGEAPLSSLLPVIAFGAPSVMCSGDNLLHKLGLPRSHVQSITMHRDIVPRAFSCNYPNHVAEILKAVNGNLRNHPCLNNQKLLYAPMGEFLILQPDEKFSPQHDLLPSGCGLYLLSCPLSDPKDADKQLRAAQAVFLNSPHPLEILRDHAAYGSEGTIKRDHDMNSYLKSVRSVIRQELNNLRKAKREQRRKLWWPLVMPRGIQTGIFVARTVALGNVGQGQINFSGIVQSGRESLKRFSRLVASQHMHLLVVLLYPARMLLLGAYRLNNFH
ncbi:Fungal lipase-like domain [Dillenia turbinata]|uniref:Fungal lipase-like domain n=1 Tax=Dillenia turbinata TaxID=194707 RepID=A0AAN8ZNQ4_9MAGN